GDVPSRGPADRRRLHRVPDGAAGRGRGRVAAGHGAVVPSRRGQSARHRRACRSGRSPRGRRPGGRGLLAGRGGARGTGHVPSPARRDRPRRDVSAAPLLIAGERPRAGHRWCCAVSRPRRHARGRCLMDIALTAGQRRLRAELREYFAALITPDERKLLLSERHGPTYREIVRRMGRDGWLGVGWPEEYGGRGFGPVEQHIFVDEAARADVQLPSVTLQTVGPTLQRYGTEEQNRRFLPALLAGEVHFAIGYSEPDAGTDLAALRTTAIRDGESYVVNGQKIFTTGGHDADYIWLAVRTVPDAPRHRGISFIIVDTTDPGFSWTPIITCDGAHHVN